MPASMARLSLAALLSSFIPAARSRRRPPQPLVKPVHARLGAFPAFLVALPENFRLGLLAEHESSAQPCIAKADNLLRNRIVVVTRQFAKRLAAT